MSARYYGMMRRMKPPPEAMRYVRRRLSKMADARYRDFAVRLIPGEKRMLGVRLPALRALAKELARSGVRFSPPPADACMEELMLSGMLIGYAPGLSLHERLQELGDFVPYIDNWSICDSCCATYTFARKERAAVWEWLAPYLHEQGEFTTRFGVVMLLMHFKQEAEWAARVAAALPGIKAQGFYAEMAIAWCACELCLLYPHLADRLLSTLPAPVLRLTRRKLRESNRPHKGISKKCPE